MKGAHFLRAVEEAAGRPALDRALSVFFKARVGTAAGMGDLVATIHEETGFDPTDLVEAWLRRRGRPD